jgi:hypothetical protein
MVMNLLFLVGGTGSAQLTPKKTPHLVVTLGIWGHLLGFTGVSGLRREFLGTWGFRERGR